MSGKLLNPELIMLDIEADTSSDVITAMVNALFKKGYVKDSYLDAILKREQEYCTGLPGNGYGVAIPHTDQEHVLKSGIAIALLKKPVKFGMMGNPDELIDVELCFMLGLNKAHSHVEVLQNLMSVIQDEELMQRIKNVASQSELYELLRANIEQGKEVLV